MTRDSQTIGTSVWVDKDNCEYYQEATSMELTEFGAVVLRDENNDLVKAFAPGSWALVEPGVAKLFRKSEQS